MLCFWGLSTEPGKGLRPVHVAEQLVETGPKEADGGTSRRCHERWLVRGCSSTFKQSVGLSQRRNAAEILTEGGYTSSERHK